MQHFKIIGKTLLGEKYVMKMDNIMPRLAIKPENKPCFVQDQSHEEHEQILLAFAVCHLFSMTSVVSNYVLYGLLNDNFKQVSAVEIKVYLKDSFVSELSLISSPNLKIT